MAACRRLSYEIGTCVKVPPNNDFCCCAKFIAKPAMEQFN